MRVSNLHMHSYADTAHIRTETSTTIDIETHAHIDLNRSEGRDGGEGRIKSTRVS